MWPNPRSEIRLLETTHCDSFARSVGDERAVRFAPAASTPRLAVRRNRHWRRRSSRLVMRLAVSCTLERPATRFPYKSFFGVLFGRITYDNWLARCRKMPGVEFSMKQTSWVKSICPVNGQLLSVNRVKPVQENALDGKYQN